MIHDELVHGVIRCIAVSQVRYSWPARVDKFPACKLMLLSVAGKHMKMHIRINHHQHQKIDFVVMKCGGERKFNMSGDGMQFRKTFFTQLGKHLDWFVSRENQCAECCLRRSQHNRPMAILTYNGLRCAKFAHRGIEIDKG